MASSPPPVGERFQLIPHQHCLLAPESQRQPRGKIANLTGAHAANARARRRQSPRPASGRRAHRPRLRRWFHPGAAQSLMRPRTGGAGLSHAGVHGDDHVPTRHPLRGQGGLVSQRPYGCRHPSLPPSLPVQAIRCVRTAYLTGRAVRTYVRTWMVAAARPAWTPAPARRPPATERRRR